MTKQHLETSADAYFAILPEWILDAAITSNAVRCYAVLRRYADKAGSCHPTRSTLAERCRFSLATLDRALLELQDVGAIHVTNRRSKAGDWTSNVYQLRTLPPEGVSSPVRTPLLTGDDTGVLTGDEQTKAITNQSQELDARSISSDVGDLAAKSWWEAQQVKPVGKRAWHALRNVCRAAADRGYSLEQITQALDRIGTVPSVAQLDRELKRPSAGREGNRERHLRDAAQRLREQQELEAIALLSGEQR